MTDHPDLASAARQAHDVLDAAFGHADAPYTPAALEALTVLRAALSAHREGSTAPADTFEIVEDGGYFEVQRTSTTPHRVVSQESVHGTRAAAEARVAELLGDLPADTPEPETSCHHWYGDPEDDGEPCSPDCRRRGPAAAGSPMSESASATPEGGQPSDDELLARATEFVRTYEHIPNMRPYVELAGDLASALRRKGLASVIASKAREFDMVTIAGLERELAEARGHCPHVVSSDAGTSFCDRAERSHGEVLAQTETQPWPYGGGSFVNLNTPPGTRVVVRADQEATDGQ